MLCFVFSIATPPPLLSFGQDNDIHDGGCAPLPRFSDTCTGFGCTCTQYCHSYVYIQ
jgi:hypothetical protein